MMGLYELGPDRVWGAMLMGWIWMLVVAAAIFAGIVLIARAAARRPSEQPVDVLRKRYAAGELTREQFEKMKRNVA
ncbi:MAG TPA: SHOCT domain-containing protein [bacterium]|nr:SHOCT domain-containing protein [bacterium]